MGLHHIGAASAEQREHRIVRRRAGFYQQFGQPLGDLASVLYRFAGLLAASLVVDGRHTLFVAAYLAHRDNALVEARQRNAGALRRRHAGIAAHHIAWGAISVSGRLIAHKGSPRPLYPFQRQARQRCCWIPTAFFVV